MKRSMLEGEGVVFEKDGRVNGSFMCADIPEGERQDVVAQQASGSTRETQSSVGKKGSNKSDGKENETGEPSDDDLRNVTVDMLRRRGPLKTC